MFRELLSVAVALAVVIPAMGTGARQQPPSNGSPTNQSPVNQSPQDPQPSNQSPSNQSGPQPQDPAAVLFTTDAGLVLHAVKAASVEDYEAAILALKDAFTAAADPETQKVAAAWKIYKAVEADAKSNVIYVHVLDPAVDGVDYRPSLWLDKLLAGAPADLLAKYRDSFAVPPTKLSLTEVKRKGG